MLAAMKEVRRLTAFEMNYLGINRLGYGRVHAAHRPGPRLLSSYPAARYRSNPNKAGSP
jgi:hypothetical protein